MLRHVTGIQIINDGGRGENRKLIKTENNGGDRKTQSVECRELTVRSRVAAGVGKPPVCTQRNEAWFRR